MFVDDWEFVPCFLCIQLNALHGVSFIIMFPVILKLNC